MQQQGLEPSRDGKRLSMVLTGAQLCDEAVREEGGLGQDIVIGGEEEEDEEEEELVAEEEEYEEELGEEKVEEEGE